MMSVEAWSRSHCSSNSMIGAGSAQRTAIVWLKFWFTERPLVVARVMLRASTTPRERPSLRRQEPPSMPEPITTWGAWDAATRNDPYPLFESMRAECPVQRLRLADGHDAWLVLGHEAAQQALKDDRLSKDIVAALDEDPDVVDPGLPGPALARHMMNLDPPDHARLRRLVSRAFVPTRIAALEPSIQHIADELLDHLEATGPDSVVDLVDGFAYPLPFRVICELLGVPE